jgi:predicted lipoprotein with Yx(FWY)xxD motif
MRLFTPRPITPLLPALVLLTALVALIATPAQARAHAPAAAALVKAAPARILVTATGMTLYTFAPDKPDKSTCYATCAKYWPPLLVPKGDHPAARMGGVPGTFAATRRTDGTQQLTYDGAPLYTFLGDQKAGEMNGQGSTASHGYWWVVVAGGK